MIDNIVLSSCIARLCGICVQSGGLSNELNNICCRHADRVYAGVAIGGDRYPGTRFIDHIMRYQENPAVKMILLLGKLGALMNTCVRCSKSKKITKPVVAWCTGTCAKIFPFEVQFGHAAHALSAMQTAEAKCNPRGGGPLSGERRVPALVSDVYSRLLKEGLGQPSSSQLRKGADGLRLGEKPWTPSEAPPLFLPSAMSAATSSSMPNAHFGSLS